MTDRERYESYMRIARNLREQSEADYAEGARLCYQADQIDSGALEMLRQAERYEKYVRIARNLREQSEADYAEGARLRYQADQIDSGALEKLRQAERYEKAAARLPARAKPRTSASPLFTIGETVCIDYRKIDGDKRFYWNVQVQALYENGDLSIYYRDEDRNGQHRRLRIANCERVNY